MSFVATWMADLACNQYHLRREVQPVPGCPSVEQVTLMNTCSSLPVRNQGWLQLSDFYCITECSCNPGSVFFLLPHLFHHLTLFPCLLNLVFPVSRFLLLPHLSSFLCPTSLSSISFYLLPFLLLLVTVWIKVFRAMAVVWGMEGQKDGDVITATYYSGCLFWLRHKKINTIKSRPGINESAAKRETTVSDWGKQERMSFSPELVCQPGIIPAI